jgi:hypothetical protein
MPCQVNISPSEEANHFEVLLCRACKYLNKEQIDSLKNPGSGIYDGLMWYSNHLTNDYCQRCWNIDVLSIDDETTELEKREILKELNRIGYDLKIWPGSIELIRL